jgi:hypothetical protein
MPKLWMVNLFRTAVRGGGNPSYCHPELDPGSHNTVILTNQNSHPELDSGSRGSIRSQGYTVKPGMTILS